MRSVSVSVRYADHGIKDVIEISGYNKSTFYKYFNSMDNLLSATFNRFVKELFLFMSQATNNPNLPTLLPGKSYSTSSQASDLSI